MNYELKMVFYKKRDRRKYHIVTIIDETTGSQIVYKFFGIHKQWWHYVIDSKYSMDLSFECGLYSLKRGKSS